MKTYNEANADTVIVPRELFEHMVDYVGDLRGESLWMKDSTERLSERYDQLLRHYLQAVEIRDGS